MTGRKFLQTENSHFNYFLKAELLIDKSLLVKAREFVFGELSSDPGGHDWWHASRVSAMARKIATAEGSDPDFCEFVALLHDIPDDKRGMPEDTGLEILKNWMNLNGLDSETISKVLEIISTMSFRGGNNGTPSTLEGKIVQDADRLDALGAIGIARAMVYSGHVGQLIHDPGIPVRIKMTKEEYREGKSTAVNHFHEKLFKLPSLMNTNYARRIALEREQFMRNFLEQLMKEWDP